MRINTSQNLALTWGRPVHRERLSLEKIDENIPIRIGKQNPLNDHESIQDAEFYDIPNQTPLTSIDIYV